MATSAEDAVIVRSTIDLGRSVGVGVVAEGVEDPEVLEQLRDAGADVHLRRWSDDSARASGSTEPTRPVVSD
jgi:predicted signal transduction protein with EAL and GGDEF domain